MVHPHPVPLLSPWCPLHILILSPGVSPSCPHSVPLVLPCCPHNVSPGCPHPVPLLSAPQPPRAHGHPGNGNTRVTQHHCPQIQDKPRHSHLRTPPNQGLPPPGPFSSSFHPKTPDLLGFLLGLQRHQEDRGALAGAPEAHCVQSAGAAGTGGRWGGPPVTPQRNQPMKTPPPSRGVYLLFLLLLRLF